jgi:hypothetical protein
MWAGHGRSARLLAWLGLLGVPLWLLGFSELLQTVLPQAPLIEATPAAFMLWQLWLLLVAIWLLASGPQYAAPATDHPEGRIRVQANA